MITFLSTTLACMTCFICGSILGYGAAEREQTDKKTREIVSFTNEWVKNHPEFRGGQK